MRFALLASVLILPIDPITSGLLAKIPEDSISVEQLREKVISDQPQLVPETPAANSSQNTFTRITEIGITAPIGGRAVLVEGFDYFVRQYLAETSKKFDYRIDVSTRFNNSTFDAAGNLIPNVGFGQDDSRQFDFFASGDIRLSDKENLQLTLRSIKQSYNINVVPDQQFSEFAEQQQSPEIRRSVQINNADSPGTSLTDFRLDYNHQNFLGSAISASTYYRRLSNAERNLLDNRNGLFEGILRRTFGSKTIGAKLQLEKSLSDRFEVQWGADYEQQTKDAVQFEFFDEQIYDRTSGRIAQKVSEADYVPSYELGSFGLFAQADWQIRDRLQLSAGIRQSWLQLNIEDYTPLYDSDYNRYEGSPLSGNTLQFNDILFNAGLTYQLTPKLQLYAAFEQEYFIPDYGFNILSFPPKDLIINTALIPFQPQKVNTYKSGLKGQWQQFQGTLSVFYQDSDLGAVYTATSNQTYELIRAPQRNYGMQATFDWQPSTKWYLGATLNYSFGENDQERNGNYLALSSYEVSPLTLTTYIENQTSVEWRNRLELSYVSSRKAGFESEADLLPIQGYTIFDFSSTVKLGRGKLTFNLHNLLNQSYQTVNSQLDGFTDETLNLPGRGRTIRLIYRILW